MSENEEKAVESGEVIELNRTEWGTLEGMIRTLAGNMEQKKQIFEAIAERFNRENLLRYLERNPNANLQEAKDSARQYTGAELDSRFDYDSEKKRLWVKG